MRVLRAIAAGLVLAGLVVAIPYGLAAMVGNPFAVWPDVAAGDISNRVILAVLAAVVWVAWAQFTLATAVELVSALRRAPMPAQLPGVARFQQGAARALVSALLMITPAIGGIVAPAMASAAPAPAAVASVSHANPAADPGAAGRHAAPETKDAAAVDVRIGPDSPHTWWDLADKHTGDGANWRQVFELNINQAQPGGVRPTETGLLRDGWTLRVPAPAVENASATVDAAPEATEVTVQPGGTLSSIAAEETGDANRWPDLFEATKNTVQPDGRMLQDPNLIRPGWTITIPMPAGATSDEPATTGTEAPEVTVQEGDSLSSIAADATGDANEWPDLYEASKGTVQPDGRTLTDPNLIRPGWTITIPDADATGADATVQVPEASPDVDEADDLTARDGGSKDGGQSSTEDEVAADKMGASSVTAPATSEEPVPTQPAAATPPAQQPEQDTASAPIAGEGQSTPRIEAGASDDAAAAVRTSASAGWPLWLSTGGGVMLAGLLYVAIREGRRRGLRFRRPGRVLAPVDAGQAPLARAVAEVGMASVADAMWLTAALRHAVAAAEADPAGRLPDVVAARLSATELELVLASPAGAPAPGPWMETDGGLRWQLGRGQDIDLPDVPERMPHPFPLLATVGHTKSGDVWLLDVEMIGALRIDGDRSRAIDLMRYMALELAHNTWTDVSDVFMVGFGTEMAEAAPGGLRTVPAAKAAAEASWLTRAVAASRTDGYTDIATGRLHAAGGDWAGQAILTCAADDGGGLAGVLAPLADGHGRLSLGAVGTADSAVPGGWTVTLGRDGALSIPQLGITILAEQLPASEAADLAELLAAMRSLNDTPARPAEGDGPHAAFTDELGRVRGDLADAEPAPGPHLPGAHVRAGSLLPKSPEEYEAGGAALAEDVTALAPIVPADLAAEILSADPGLDADVADWRGADCGRPKLTLLGPVTLEACGELDKERPRTAQLVEIAAYLACHPAGVTGDKLGTDLWPDGRNVARRASTMTSKLRTWLGGEAYLPKLTGQTGGDGRYKLTGGVLIDANLVARLRIRGQARGEAGITDLHTALDLVTGRPFDAGRATGYAWLATGIWEHGHTAMIDDIAHLAVIFYLDHGNGQAALAAAQTALRGGVGSDTPLIDCAAALRSLGMDTEAEQRIQQVLETHEDTYEEDLSARINELLGAGGWQTRRRSAIL